MTPETMQIIQTTLPTLIPTLLAIGALFVRVESRFTRLEARQTGIADDVARLEKGTVDARVCEANRRATDQRFDGIDAALSRRSTVRQQAQGGT